MQFSLRTLLLAMVIIAIFTAIATWNPLLGTLGFVLCGMISALFWMIWKNAAALLACGLGLAILLLDISALSYIRTLCFELGPVETCYNVEFSRGRVQAIRLEKWPYRLPPRFYVMAVETGTWNERMFFSAPTSKLSFASCEYAVGEHSFFDMNTLLYRTCLYSMLSIPIWLIAFLLLGLAAVRAAMLRPWSKSARQLAMQDLSSPEANQGRPSSLVRYSKRWLLIAIGVSSLFFYALLILEWAFPMSAIQPPCPPALITLTFLLVLFQAVACLFVEMEFPKAVASVFSILFYVFVGVSTLFGVIAFAVPYSSLASSLFLDAASGDLQAVRFGFVFAIVVLTAGGAKSRKSIGASIQMRVALATAAFSLLIAATPSFVNFQALGRSTMEAIHGVIVVFAVLTALLQVLMLGGVFARLEKATIWLIVGLILLLLFMAGLFAFDPNFERVPLADEINKGIWQYRLIGLLAVVGFCVYRYLGQENTTGNHGNISD